MDIIPKRSDKSDLDIIPKKSDNLEEDIKMQYQDIVELALIETMKSTDDMVTDDMVTYNLSPSI